MTENKRARDAGVTIGHLPPGPNNAITDVGPCASGTRPSCAGRARSWLARDRCERA